MKLNPHSLTLFSIILILASSVYCYVHGWVLESPTDSSLLSSLLWGIHLFGGWLLLSLWSLYIQGKPKMSLWFQSIVFAFFCIVFSVATRVLLYDADKILLDLYQIVPIHGTVATILFIINYYDALSQSRWNQSPLQNPKALSPLKVMSGRGFAMIDFNDIFLIAGARNYLELTTQKGTFLLRQTMNEFQETVADMGFARVHRSHIVNLNHVSEVTTDGQGNKMIHLNNQQSVKLSNSYKREFMKITALA